MFNEKRGDVSIVSTRTVMIILLIVGFAIAVLFLVYFNLNDISDAEACHNSIVMRSILRANKFAEIGPNSLPLKCRTEKYCIQNNLVYDSTYQSLEDVCPSLESTADNRVSEVSLESDTLRESKDEIEDFLAQKLYECHSVVGEGKANFMPSESLEKKYCLICSRIEIDSRLAGDIEKQGGITYLELFEKMSQKKTKDGQTYLEYIYGMKDYRTALSTSLEQLKESSRDYSDPLLIEQIQSMTLENWKIPLMEQSAIITGGIEGGTLRDTLIGVGTGVVVAGAIIAGAFTAGATWATIPGIILIAKGTAIGLAAGAATGGPMYVYQTGSDTDFMYIAPTILPYNVDTLKSLECNSFETAP